MRVRMRACMRMSMYVKRGRMNARVSADREAFGKEMIAVPVLLVDLSVGLHGRVTFAPRAGTPRSYESLVVNRSDVMRESINRILFPPFSSLFSLFLPLSLSRFLSLSLGSQPPRTPFFFYFSLHTPAREAATERCAVACRGIVRYLSKAVLILRGPSSVAAHVKF